MKQVLITGADGFIGSHLVEECIHQGLEVSAFVYYNSFNSYGWLDSFPKSVLKNIKFFSGDIRDKTFVKKAVKGIDTIFHLAALIGIPYSYSAPGSYVDTNVHGTLNILQSALEYNVDKILVTSTSEVYGTAQYVPIDEKHPRQGQSPYSATKISADFISESFYRSFDLPISIVRPFNTYGPRQSARAVIPTIITQLLTGVKEIKLGKISPTRDFVYVKDTANGFLEIAKTDESIGEEINISSNQEISIGDLAQKIIDLLNLDAKIICDNERIRPKNSEVERLLGDNTKIKKITGWEMAYTLEKGLEATIDWFREKENLVRYKSENYNV